MVPTQPVSAGRHPGQGQKADHWLMIKNLIAQSRVSQQPLFAMLPGPGSRNPTAGAGSPQGPLARRDLQAPQQLSRLG